MMPPFVLLALGLLGAPPDGPPPEVAWRLVTPAPGEPDAVPPPRALTLTRDAPEDVVERASYRGTRRRYAQVRYGSARSVRVTVVLDEGGPDGPALYVDADRDRRVEDADRLPPPTPDRTWRVPLDCLLLEGDATTRLPRTVVLRLGATGLTLGAATAGYLEGTITRGGRPCRARRIDGDANGLYADPADQVWIDADGDGRFDPTTERALFAPVVTLAGERLALRGDAPGSRLALEPLAGAGTLRVAAARPAGAAPWLALSVTLLGRDGSVVGLSGVGATATVPAGEYRVATVTCALPDPGGGPPWNFVFAAEGARGEPRWIAVPPGGTRTLDPIGTPTLATGLDDASRRVRPGADLTASPALYTADGLNIVTCYRGNPSAPASNEGPRAVVTIEGATGDPPAASARSGFA
jgi:hypothetical protein